MGKDDEAGRVFFFEQKTAYEIHDGDWSSGVVLFRSSSSLPVTADASLVSIQIGRAPCRERV